MWELFTFAVAAIILAGIVRMVLDERHIERRQVDDATAARADQEHAAWLRGEHVVERINDYYYLCQNCGQAGSERWAITHQFLSRSFT
jgi:hypothetical protein